MKFLGERVTFSQKSRRVSDGDSNDDQQEASIVRAETQRLKELGLLESSPDKQTKKKKGESKATKERKASLNTESKNPVKRTFLQAITAALPDALFPCEFAINSTHTLVESVYGMKNTYRGKCTNVCYANAVVQLLYPIVHVWAEFERKTSISLNHSIAKIVLGLRSGVQSVIPFVSKIATKFVVGVQNDAMEFFDALLVAIEEFKTLFAIDQTIIYRCKRCKQFKYPDETLPAALERLLVEEYTIKLPMKKTKQTVTVSDCFKKVRTHEFLCRFGCPAIDAIDDQAEITRVIHFKSPYVLIQLKRFRYNDSDEVQRLSTPVAYNLKEKLKYISKFDPPKNETAYVDLTLIGIVCHLAYGPSISYVLHSNGWWRYDNESTKSCTEAQVLSERSNVYLLLYS